MGFRASEVIVLRVPKAFGTRRVGVLGLTDISLNSTPQALKPKNHLFKELLDCRLYTGWGMRFQAGLRQSLLDSKPHRGSLRLGVQGLGLKVLWDLGNLGFRGLGIKGKSSCTHQRC